MVTGVWEKLNRFGSHLCPYESGSPHSFPLYIICRQCEPSLQLNGLGEEDRNILHGTTRGWNTAADQSVLLDTAQFPPLFLLFNLCNIQKNTEIASLWNSVLRPQDYVAWKCIWKMPSLSTDLPKTFIITRATKQLYNYFPYKAVVIVENSKIAAYFLSSDIKITENKIRILSKHTKEQNVASTQSQI